MAIYISSIKDNENIVVIKHSIHIQGYYVQGFLNHAKLNLLCVIEGNTKDLEDLRSRFSYLAQSKEKFQVDEKLYAFIQQGISAKFYQDFLVNQICYEQQMGLLNEDVIKVQVNYD